ADLAGAAGAAAWTPHREGQPDRASRRCGGRLDGGAARAAPPGWGDAELPELAPAVVADPVGGPGRRQDGADPDQSDAGRLQRRLDVPGDDGSGRAPGVGRGQLDQQCGIVTTLTPADVTHDAEVVQGEHRDLR